MIDSLIELKTTAATATLARQQHSKTSRDRKTETKQNRNCIDKQTRKLEQWDTASNATYGIEKKDSQPPPPKHTLLTLFTFYQ